MTNIEKKEKLIDIINRLPEDEMLDVIGFLYEEGSIDEGLYLEIKALYRE